MKRLLIFILIPTAAILFAYFVRLWANDPSTGHLALGVVGFGMSFVFGKTILRTLLSSWHASRKRMFIRMVRLAGVLRRLNQPAPETQLLTAVAICILIVTWACGLFFPSLTPNSVPASVAISIAAIAGVIDAGHRAKKLTKWAWGRTAGKLILAGIAAVTAIVASSAAAHLVYDLTGTVLAANGKFVNAATAVAWPLLFLCVMAVFVALITMVELILVTAGWIVLYAAERLLGLSRVVKQRILLGSVAARRGETVSETTAFFYLLRAIGKTFACSIFLIVVRIMLHSPWPSLRTTAMSAMAALDYEPGNTCTPDDKRYGMRLDDKTRSILVMVNGKVDHAETVTCAPPAN
jgi:hypothetical protein